MREFLEFVDPGLVGVIPSEARDLLFERGETRQSAIRLDSHVGGLLASGLERKDINPASGKLNPL
jgi:hypothetical protein